MPSSPYRLWLKALVPLAIFAVAAAFVACLWKLATAWLLYARL